ncbi:MAG: response regulator [Alphaproteobacteria bacterium]
MRDRGHASASLLIVDHNQSLAQLMRSQLKYLGFRQVEIAKDTDQALAWLTQNQFDAVLCDASAGPRPGEAFARAARTAPGVIDPYLSLLVLSHQPTWRMVNACRDAGASGFLARPLSGMQLRDKIVSTLAKRRRFVRCQTFFGPDRRRTLRPPYDGPERREGRGMETQVIPSRRRSA